MSFSETFRDPALLNSRVLRRFASLLEPKSGAELEAMASDAEKLTRQNFGRTMRLFAPLYLSNECVNICKYCGFSRDNPILRVTLSVDQVEAEARHLWAQGFRNVLLVAGEHPKFVSSDYLAQCVARLSEFIPALSLEVGPMETVDYVPSVQAGAEGLVVYQETYDRAAYAELHTAGPKKDFDWRLDCPERAYAAGFRRLGIGALFGSRAVGGGGAASGRACRLSAAPLLEVVGHGFAAAAASGGGPVRAAARFQRPRAGAGDPRAAALFSAGRHRAFDAGSGRACATGWCAWA